MLSQVERGETSPTLAIAERIAGGLELTPVPAAAPRRGRRRGRRARRASAATVARARPPLRGAHAAAARPARRGLAARAGARRRAPAGPDDPPIHEPGSRETAVVVDGPLRFVCGGAAHELDEGDAVTFDADLPHHFENPGGGEARFFAVVAAGLRRS